MELTISHRQREGDLGQTLVTIRVFQEIDACENQVRNGAILVIPWSLTKPVWHGASMAACHYGY
jgi:hypothetical protein